MHARVTLPALVALAAACRVDTPSGADAGSTGSGDEQPTATGVSADDTTADATDPSGDTDVDLDTSGADLPAIRLSEIDCHGRDAIEIAAPEGTDLGGLEIVVDGTTVFTVPADTVAAGFFVVREASAGRQGLSGNVGCSDDVVVLSRGGEVFDEASFPAFPGSFKGTTWCRVADAAHELCTPTIDGENARWVDPAPILFDRVDPIEIDLTIDAAGIAALDIEPREYVAGTFTVTDDGVTSEPLTIGIALKGSPIGSFTDLSGKAAFKLKFDFMIDDQRYLGLEGLKLNNMREDASQLHEAIGYAIFEAAGVPAPRAGFAEVRLNGESYGLHATIERADRTFLSRHFPETQHLYEGTFGLDVNPGRESEFFVDEGDPLDTSDLTALMATSVVPANEFLAALEANVHLEPTLRMWAASMWMGHWDGYAAGRNNYGLQSDDAGVFDFIPSGLDQTSEFGLDLITGQSPIQERGVLYDRCIDNDECRARYVLALEDTGLAIVEFDVPEEIDAVAAAIQPWVDADPRRENSVGNVANAQDEARGFWFERAKLFP